MNQSLEPWMIISLHIHHCGRMLDIASHMGLN